MIHKTIVLSVFLLLNLNTSCSQQLPTEGIKNGLPITIDQQTYQTLEGYINVPEDRLQPNSRRLLIPFLVIKSSSKHPSHPIFWLDGGPGGTNILSIQKIAQSHPGQILANHDFVCVGYRGVDGTVSLKSAKVNKALKGIGHQMLSQASLKEMEKQVSAYYRELKQSGIQIDHYNITQVIEDFEYARQFLGYQKINLLSTSYGTRVALLYSYRHPEVLHRSLMIGACPPGYFLPRAEFAEAMIHRYDSIYSAQKDANYKGSIKEAMKKAFREMPKRWATFKLDPEKIKAGTASALYNRGFATMAFDAYFKAAKNQDYSGLFLLQKIQDMNNIDAIGDVYCKTISADASILIPEENRASAQTILGENMALIYQRTAKSWPIQPIEEHEARIQNTAVPTLVISGDLDFRTPAWITQKVLMPSLLSGQHLVLKNMSHLDILMNVMKSPAFLQQYFDTGRADASLLPTVDRIDFHSNASVSKAKIFVIGVIK